MLKSKWVQQLLRLLIALLGAGVGVAGTLAVIQLHRWMYPNRGLDGSWVVLTYIGSALVGALVFYLLSNALLRKCSEWFGSLEKQLDRLSTSQMVFGVGGLVSGLLIAMLSSQILHFLGESIFTTAVSAILYVLLGTTGLSIGIRRSDDLAAMMGRLPGLKDKRSRKANAARPKLLDASALIDGRILEICRIGFVEGELVLPGFVLEELRRLSDSSDPLRRSRGRRGLEAAKKLQELPGIPFRQDDAADDDASSETDVRLLRLAQSLNGAIITADYGLQKVAAVAGLSVLNLNELAGALRTSVQTGDEMSVTLLKEGKEAQQGVGYMPDGTMIVVEGGRAHLGQTVTVVVTSALQTNAGRMIFARIK